MGEINMLLKFSRTSIPSDNWNIRRVLEAIIKTCLLPNIKLWGN